MVSRPRDPRVLPPIVYHFLGCIVFRMLCCNCDPHCFSSLHVPALSHSPGSCSHSIKRSGLHCPEFPGLPWLLGPKHQSKVFVLTERFRYPDSPCGSMTDVVFSLSPCVYPCISAYGLVSLNWWLLVIHQHTRIMAQILFHMITHFQKAWQYNFFTNYIM